ncbi:type 1 glutamine amidotransferase domain-containing protein [Chryseotalea sanaruensis]|uniref:Type 1 glutamine amidotransferase domain-containing protein n=1 Tax=Chryseotalea sanaruensis TaxID=2482724 RepID=A0A401UF61_9BACT|nr:type 1 glutamine amidotransferase domain-containing protein [Chryseotalea sanaruensis]GCC53490.1 type 1 glutamine amidotransferase domain-containing protein [Chryseotalea sanaruensis]
MSGKRKIIKWSLIVLAGLFVTIVLFGVWFMSLLPPSPESVKDIKAVSPAELPYLTENIVPNRGKILAVVTSTSQMGSSGKSTGFELTELSRAYYVFQANGFEVDVASPLGGAPPAVIDGDDMNEYDYAFLNDAFAQAKIKGSIAMKDVDPKAYQAVYFVGGKGTMYDFPDNEYIQSLVREYYESGKIVSAVCHGPAALVNVTLSSGALLLANRQISSFTNKEELLLIPDAAEIFPFLLQDKLIENGASFNEGFMYLNKVSKDGNLITGQNPWSTWQVAELVIEQMGYKPKQRIITTEENSISVLETFEAEGYSQAKVAIDRFCTRDAMSIDRQLIAMHSIVAAMQFDLIRAVKLTRLLSYSNGYL